MAKEEILDLVDDDDKVIGQIARNSKKYNDSDGNIRVVNAFVKRDGKIWIPKRTNQKAIFPGAFDFSVGGHVESGEDYEETFKRETLEELDIDVDKHSWRVLGKLEPKKHGVSAFMTIYEIDIEDDPNYNKDDFTEAFWLTPQEALYMFTQGNYFKGDLPSAIRIFYILK